MHCKFEFLYYCTHMAATYVDLHQHNCYELVYYTRGTGTMNLNGVVYHYQPQSITLTRPNYTHDERHEEETDVIFIGFSYDDYPISLENGIYNDANKEEILQLLLQMKQEMVEKKPFYEIKLNLLTQEIIIALERTGKIVSDTVELDKLLYARTFIDENYNQKLNLHTLADLSGFSYDYFRHLFKYNTGYSPIQYLIRKRVEQAKLLLCNSDQTVLSIAMNCGFSTSSQFSKVFKEITGDLPTEFRRKSVKRTRPFIEPAD